MTNYPYTLTEFPHQGEPRTWVLFDQDHLFKVIDHCPSYTDLHVQQGNATYVEDQDGEINFTGEIHTPEAYFDFLRNDLKMLEVTPCGDKHDAE